MQIIDLIPDLRPVILAARELRDSRNTLAQFLPNVNRQTVSYRLGRRKRLDQTVPIRALDAPAVPIRRPGLVDVRGDLPAVTPIIDLSEQDLTNEMIIAQQLAGIAVDWQGPVEDSAAQVALTTDNTYELMRGQLLSTGTIALESADGATHEVDFEVPSDNIITVADEWDIEDPQTVFENLKAAHEAFIDSDGDVAGVALTTINVYNLMVGALQALYPQRPIGENELRAHLANLRIPQVYTYDRKFLGADGKKTRVYPEGHLTFLPSGNPVGETQLGVTQEAVQQVQRRILTPQQAPGLTIVTLGQDNPVQRAVKGASIGMPVLRDNESVVVLKGMLAEADA